MGQGQSSDHNGNKEQKHDNDDSTTDKEQSMEIARHAQQGN
jgi:hypothetical protein